MHKSKIFKVVFKYEPYGGDTKKAVKGNPAALVFLKEICTSPTVKVVADDIGAALDYATKHFEEIAKEYDQSTYFLTDIQRIEEIEEEVLC